MFKPNADHELPTIKSARRRDETTLRLGGIGDNWHMSWAADDRQVVAMCDGYGWPSTVRRSYNSRLYRITGSPPGVRFEDVPGYPELLSDTKTPGGFSRYYGFGTLAIDGRIYQFLSTPNVPFDQPSPRFVGAKLIYSGDDGATWRNQDGSSPVSWEVWHTRSKQNMVFFEESQEAFALLTILQMGRNYGYNSDGFVYVYAPNGNAGGTMNELAMFRVPRDRILSRGAYEYFAGTRDNGPVWTADIDARGIVCSFPRGWVNTTIHPYSWQPSVVYNQPLGVYMMANWGMGCAHDGSWFGKPSYLGLWVAPDPWGPWEQVHEETAWTPCDDQGARAYQPQIAPKWIAPDGKTFWLVWTDFQEDAGAVTARRTGESTALSATVEEAIDRMAMLRPYYAFNVQRVDLEVG